MVKNAQTTFYDPAFKLSTKIINHLIKNWNPRGNEVLYSINIPMVERLLHEDRMKIYWTSVWRSSYERLFAKVPRLAETNSSYKVEEATSQLTDAAVPSEGGGHSRNIAQVENLVFTFDPDLSGLLDKTAAPEGTDGWALNVNAVSVTPYLTSFAELPETEHGFSCVDDREWKFEL